MLTQPKREQYDEPDQDHDVETARVGPDPLPVLAQNNADVGEAERPKERAHERIQRESTERDTRGARWEGDERAHDRKEAGPERDLETVTTKPSIGPVIFLHANHPPPGELRGERAAPFHPKPVRDPGTEHVSDRPR